MSEPSYIITGASSGIGAALALRLAADGSNLGLIARREERLEDVAQACRKHGVNVGTRLADVTKHAGLKSAILELDDVLEGADVLISNAGVAIPTPADEGEVADIQTVIDVNLTGALAAIYSILPRFRERGAGQAVGIASVAGYRGLPGSSAYCASKSGFITALESLRLELRKEDIPVTTICPGFVRSEMTDDNEFEMPWLMDTDRAAKKIIAAIDAEKKFYAFPWQMRWTMRLAKVLPRWLYDRIMQRHVGTYSKG